MSTLTPEEVMQKVQTGKPYTLLLLLPGKPLDADEATKQQLQWQHLAHLFQLEQEGKTSVFGPVSGSETLNGIIICNTTDKQEIGNWMADDPYIQGGYLTYSLHDFFTIPGQVIRS